MMALDLPGIFKNASSLIYLDLSQNDFTYIPADTFRDLVNLQYLLCKNNRLSVFDWKIHHLHILKMIDLSQNSLQTLSLKIRNQLDFLATSASFKDFKLRGNKFICDCITLDFVKWIHQCPLHILDKEKLLCADSVPLTMVNPDSLRDACILPIWTATVIPLVICFAVVTTVSLVFRFRWAVRWHIYGVKTKLQYYAGVTQNEGENSRYHAFISYANQDEKWVTDCLLPKLVDEWATNVCTSQDFTPGRPIFTNIADAMSNSTYIILVVTKSFARSQWCDFEMHMALSKDPTKVVVCYMQEVQYRNMSKSLRFLLKTVNYIEWGRDARIQRMFWERLRLSLEHVR